MGEKEKSEKRPKQQIAIGTRAADAKLIGRILAYQKENNFKSGADAVRSLCEIALTFKKLTK